MNGRADAAIGAAEGAVAGALLFGFLGTTVSVDAARIAAIGGLAPGAIVGTAVYLRRQGRDRAPETASWFGALAAVSAAALLYLHRSMYVNVRLPASEGEAPVERLWSAMLAIAIAVPAAALGAALARTVAVRVPAAYRRLDTGSKLLLPVAALAALLPAAGLFRAIDVRSPRTRGELYEKLYNAQDTMRTAVNEETLELVRFARLASGAAGLRDPTAVRALAGTLPLDLLVVTAADGIGLIELASPDNTVTIDDVAPVTSGGSWGDLPEFAAAVANPGVVATGPRERGRHLLVAVHATPDDGALIAGIDLERMQVEADIRARAAVAIYDASGRRVTGSAAGLPGTIDRGFAPRIVAVRSLSGPRTVVLTAMPWFFPALSGRRDGLRWGSVGRENGYLVVGVMADGLVPSASGDAATVAALAAAAAAVVAAARMLHRRTLSGAGG